MSAFFTSDTHFGHENILTFCKRPFETVDEMDAAMIRNINSRLDPGDELFHLGDFCWRNPEYWRNMRKQIHAKRIYLIRGNHDEQVPGGLFEWVKDYYEYKQEKQVIVLAHYAHRSWWRSYRGTWHLYGHTHGGLDPYGKSFDIGVDCHNFYPLSFEEVKEKMDALPIAVSERGFAFHPKPLMEESQTS